ncbi:DMT family transporter [Ferrovibrio sp.]|uniref:DMT family transporter n=1 Tax=Ferrovibrio sp. TaxID=1917215 RepID=UPI0035AF3EB5
MSFTFSSLSQGNPRGILSMLGAILLFVSNDALIKLSSQHASFAQAVFLRGLMVTALAFILVLTQGHGRKLAILLQPKVLLRSSADLGATAFYVLALFHMPLGNLTSISMASPLLMTAVAAILLREQVGWRRWCAVGIGFCGVLLIVQPASEGFNSWSLLAIGCMFCVMLRDLTTRFIGAALPATLLVLGSCLIIMLVAGLLMLFEGWRAISLHGVLLLAGSAFCLVGGYMLSVDCMRHGELSVISPFRYTALVWSLLFGYLIWNEVPNLVAAIGIAIVLASGLYLIHRERIRVREAGATGK